MLCLFGETEAGSAGKQPAKGYWRSSDGKPYKGNDGRNAPTALLAEIGKAASVTEGGIGWQDMTFLRHQSSLRSAFVVLDENGNELNATDSWVICHSAIDAVIKKVGGGKPVEPSKVILEADKLAASHFRKPTAKYVLISSLSIEEFPAKRIELHGCSIFTFGEARCSLSSSCRFGRAALPRSN